MIEDDYLDVLGKAMRGNGLDEQALAERAGVDEDRWQKFMSGDFSAEVASACARVLGLGADAYARLPDYQPEPLAIDGIQRIELPFGGYGVNVWWLELDGVAVLFDTGCAAHDLAPKLPREPDLVCITHGHHDHVGGLGCFSGGAVPVRAPGDVEGAASIASGQSLECGPFRFETLDVSGHFTPSVAYVVGGFERPVMVVGDALFAGSMGKCANPELYRDALENLKLAFAGCPDDLVILPGHGPATTLGEEWRANPFLAGMSALEEGS